MAQDIIIKGTEVKYKVGLTASGFDMDTDDFFFTVSCGGVEKVIHKSELVYDDELWYLCFGTDEFAPGRMTVASTALIPDSDFPDGLRAAVCTTVLGILKNE